MRRQDDHRSGATGGPRQEARVDRGPPRVNIGCVSGDALSLWLISDTRLQYLHNMGKNSIEAIDSKWWFLCIATDLGVCARCCEITV